MQIMYPKHHLGYVKANVHCHLRCCHLRCHGITSCMRTRIPTCKMYNLNGCKYYTTPQCQTYPRSATGFLERYIYIRQHPKRTLCNHPNWYSIRTSQLQESSSRQGRVDVETELRYRPANLFTNYIRVSLLIFIFLGSSHSWISRS